MSEEQLHYLENLWAVRLRELIKERDSRLEWVRRGLVDHSDIYARIGFESYLEPELDHLRAIGVARSECWLKAFELDGKPLSPEAIEEALLDASAHMTSATDALFKQKKNEIQSMRPIPPGFTTQSIPGPSELSSRLAKVQGEAKDQLRHKLTIQMYASRDREHAQASASSPSVNQVININGPNARVDLDGIDNSTNLVSEDALSSEVRKAVEEGVAESPAKNDDLLVRWKNKKPVAYLIALAAIASGIASFTDSVSKIQTAVEEWIFPVRTVKLPFDTGWILAGYYDQSTKRFSQGHYIKIAKTNYRDKQELPRIGDWVRVAGERHVVIPEYKKEGLAHQMQAPLADLVDEDYTGVTLPSGTVMEVRDIGGGSYPGRASAVWVRVGAAPR